MLKQADKKQLQVRCLTAGLLRALVQGLGSHLLGQNFQQKDQIKVRFRKHKKHSAAFCSAHDFFFMF